MCYRFSQLLSFTFNRTVGQVVVVGPAGVYLFLDRFVVLFCNIRVRFLQHSEVVLHVQELLDRDFRLLRVEDQRVQALILPLRVAVELPVVGIDSSFLVLQTRREVAVVRDAVRAGDDLKKQALHGITAASACQLRHPRRAYRPHPSISSLDYHGKYSEL